MNYQRSTIGAPTVKESLRAFYKPIHDNTFDDLIRQLDSITVKPIEKS
jgi:hypothetical protein